MPKDIFENELQPGDEVAILTTCQHQLSVGKGTFLGVHANGGFMVRRTLYRRSPVDSDGNPVKWNSRHRTGWADVPYELKSTLQLNRVIKIN